MKLSSEQSFICMSKAWSRIRQTAWLVTSNSTACAPKTTRDSEFWVCFAWRLHTQNGSKTTKVFKEDHSALLVEFGLIIKVVLSSSIETPSVETCFKSSSYFTNANVSFGCLRQNSGATANVFFFLVYKNICLEKGQCHPFFEHLLICT